MEAKLAKKELIKEAEAHLKALLFGMQGADGYLELRTIPEREKNPDEKGKSFWIPTAAEDGEITAAATWAANENKSGRGVFVGVNPRVRESGSKKDVERMTTAFVDLDLDKRGIDRETALAEIEAISPVPPNLVTDSGGGLHVMYFMAPTDDYAKWQSIQRALHDKFQHIGSDKSVVTDSSRILRLTPFANWKYEKDEGGRRTALRTFMPVERRPQADTVAAMFGANDLRADSGSASSGLPASIPEGGTASSEGRNTMLFKEAARLRDRSYDFDEMLPALRAINLRRAVPPLPDEEVEAIAKSVLRYAPTHSLGVPEDFEVDSFGYKLEDFLNQEFPPIEWIIHGLNNGELGQMVATPNVGKTTISLNLAMSMAVGREFYPLYEGGRPMRVMYLDFENRAGFLQMDMRRMAQNFDPMERQLIHRNLFIVVDQEVYKAEFNLSNEDHMALLLKQATDFGADLIIVDTMAAAFTLTNENDNSEAERAVIKPLKHVAKETGAAILVIHHKGKQGETGDRSDIYAGRGASAFAAAFRAVYMVKPLKDGAGRVVDNHIVLSAPKVKGKAFDETVMELDFPRRWFEPSNITLGTDESTYDLVWSIISEPMSRQQIIARLREGHEDNPISDSTVSRALKLGLQNGRLKRGVKQGIYAPGEILTPEPDGQQGAPNAEEGGEGDASIGPVQTLGDEGEEVIG
jgi:hypothetical protein